MRGLFGLKRAATSDMVGGIRAAQLDAVFRQMPIALAVNIVNAAVTVAVLQRLAPTAIPLAWFCIVFLLTLGRWALWRRTGVFARKSPTYILGRWLRSSARFWRV
jgi:hypothetical protein